MAAVLELQDVSKVFGGLQAVSSVSFHVEEGERLVILGPNGAGKTTLFHCITGTLPISGGKIKLLGIDVTRFPADRRMRLGIGRTFQITNLFGGLTPVENVMLAIHGRGNGARALWRRWTDSRKDLELAHAQLAKVGLDEFADEPVSELSYGQRRKLELALAMVGNPKVLFLDEPCAGLAPAERQSFSEMIHAVPSDVTIIMVEHDMDIAFQIASRLVVMNMGEVICDGEPEAVRSNERVQGVYLGHG